MMCFFQVVLSEEMQSVVVVLLQIAETLTDMMNNILPTIDTLQSFLFSIQDLDLMANPEFSHVRILFTSVQLHTSVNLHQQ